MMRLIDADELMKIYTRYEFTSDMGDAMEILDNTPTVDAVPVIRCKDCKLWMKNPYRESSVFGLCFKHKDIAIATDETDWCSWAERRNNEIN